MYDFKNWIVRLKWNVQVEKSGEKKIGGGSKRIEIDLLYYFDELGNVTKKFKIYGVISIIIIKTGVDGTTHNTSQFIFSSILYFFLCFKQRTSVDEKIRFNL